MIMAMNHYAPRLTDKFMEKVFAKQTKSERPPRPRQDNGLDHGAGRLQERGNYPGHTRETSVYTSSSMHPLVTAALVAGAGFGVAALLSSSGKANRHSARKADEQGRTDQWVE